jgi:sec-independent protein translocase protein TatB
MFDIGWGELVVIGVVALIVIGPKELPTVLRTLGQAMGKVRRMANEFQGQFQEALREAELHDLKKQAEDIGSDISSSMNEFSSFDPMADTKEAIDRSFDAVPNIEPATEAATPAVGESAANEAVADQAPAAIAHAPEAAAEPPPVAAEDFATATPAKPAGGSA